MSIFKGRRVAVHGPPEVEAVQERPGVPRLQPSAVAVTGVEGTATITAVRATGARVNGNPVLDLDLVVLLPGRPPLPTTTREPVMAHLVARAQAGTQVRVKVDPAQLSDVFIDWVSPVRA